MALDERKRPDLVEEVHRAYPSQSVQLGTYRIALSFEHQPAGLFKHMSVSSHRKGKVPGLEVMKVVMDAFGFSGMPLQRPGRIWVEEFERNWHAVNVIEIEPGYDDGQPS